MRTGFYSDERTFWHIAGRHVLVQPATGWVQPSATAGLAESPETKRRLLNLLDVSGILAQLDRRTADPLTRTELERVHMPAYLDLLIELSRASGGDAGPNAPVGPGSYDIARLSAGLVSRAVMDVWDGKVANAYALSRPPGHHCLKDRGMGFCLLANIALAVEMLIEERGADRVAVVDWDVHHGNGTESIFYDRADILTISLHQEGGFPKGGTVERRGHGAGRGFNINVPLMPGSGHAAYLDAFSLIVEPALQRFAPDMIIVACGFDASGFDPLSRMLAYSSTFKAMTVRIKEMAQSLCRGRLVLVHEGGYSEGYVPFCGLATIEALAGIESGVCDLEIGRFEHAQPCGEHVALQEHLLRQIASVFKLTA